MFKAKVIVYLSQTQTQTTFYFSNHMIMKQGNTCTYINGLTNNNKKWRLYLHKLQLYIKEQHSESFKCWSAISRFNTTVNPWLWISSPGIKTQLVDQQLFTTGLKYGELFINKKTTTLVYDDYEQDLSSTLMVIGININ